jgi:hypothetical protein
LHPGIMDGLVEAAGRLGVAPPAAIA